MAMRIIAITLIIVISFGLAFAIDLGLDFVERSIFPRDYGEYVSKYSAEYNVPEYIIYSIIKTESDFKPLAKSSAGACGLMQMVPDTFSWLTGEEHLGEYLPEDALFIPEINIKYGTYYLNYLYKKFDHNWDTVFAAYNAGEGNVSKWLADSSYSDGNGNLTDIPFSETKNYVKKVNSSMEFYKKLYYNKNYKGVLS